MGFKNMYMHVHILMYDGYSLMSLIEKSGARNTSQLVHMSDERQNGRLLCNRQCNI